MINPKAIPDTHCNLCGKNQFKVIENHNSTFKVLQCLSCQLVFVNPCPEKIFLAQHYDDNYYTEWLTKQNEPRSRMWNNRLNKLEKFSHCGRMLDVGCATGTFLEIAKKRGWEVYGTELSPYAAQHAENALGVPIFCGELSDSPFPNNFFDVITMWHVLEHTIDPMLYLQILHRILKPDGLLVVAVPNVDDQVMRIAYRLVKGRSLSLFSEGDREIHLFHFSTKTIRGYLEKTGFHHLHIGPDYGEINNFKKAINMIAVILSHLTGADLFNAIEVYATRNN